PSGTSIQGLLEDALREFDDGDVAVAGAGRTDAGVHALGQVASFTLDRAIDAATIVRALNAKLPADVRVLDAVAGPSTFHARCDARGTRSRYRIWNGEVVTPFERRYVWHIPEPLDMASMDRAARFIEGTHDFAVFQGAGSDTPTTERTVFSSRIADFGLCSEIPNQSPIRNPQSKILVYEVCGNGFLRYMVRSIVGSLVEIGRGRRDAEWLRTLIASRDRAQAG